MNLLMFRGRCRRCEARYGPAARPLRRSARLQAQEVSPTAVDSPSVLDALEFDLTVEDKRHCRCSALSRHIGVVQAGSALPRALTQQGGPQSTFHLFGKLQASRLRALGSIGCAV